MGQVMPEGAEVKLSADLIRPIIQNQLVIDAHPAVNSRYDNGNDPEGYRDFMEHLKSGQCRVIDVQVKGKFMYWTFSGSRYMFNSFGMSGQWSEARSKHPCFIFQHAPSLDRIPEYKQLVFNDPRHFGTIKFTNNPNDLANKLNELGWDPLQMPLKDNFDWIKKKLAKTNKPIAEALMDQKVFCGVGNYTRAELLYTSRTNPFRPANSLTDNEIKQLCQAAIDTMEASYQNNGATISTYLTPNGEKGNYSNHFQIYGQKQDPLGNPVIKQDLAGRTLHWCPALQQ